MTCGQLLSDTEGNTRIGEYLLKNKIGEGGIGVVYRAIHESLGREVAIKILNEKSFGDVKNMERFRREIRMHHQLKHPNIIESLDIYEEGESLALVMELLSGCNLKEYINHRGIIPLGGVISVALSVLSALEKAHTRAIIHRDLKPSNIFITDDGDAKLMDFGLAKPTFSGAHDITENGVTVGTYLYMAPEQIIGKEIGPFTDLYAFGIILYRMCTNTLPFTSTGGGEFEIMEKQVRQKPQNPKELNPDMPDELAQIIMDLLEKEPADRPKDCAEVIERISKLGEPSKLCLTQGNSEAEQVKTFSDLNSNLKKISTVASRLDDEVDTATVSYNSLLGVFLVESPEAPETPPFDMLQPPAIDRERLKMLKIAISNIPPLPEIWHQVQAVFEDPNSSAADLAKIIAQDAVLTAYILKACNSAAYMPAGSKETSDAAIALTRIGMVGAQTLILSAVAPEFSTEARSSSAVRRIWFHGQATAMIASTLSEYSSVVDGNSASMFGLLHDIGKLVILHAESEEKIQALKERIEAGQDSLSAEIQVLGYTHIDAGMMLALHWKLPRKLHRFIYYHHFPSWQKPESWPPDMQAPVMLVHMAHLVLSSILADEHIKDRSFGEPVKNPHDGVWQDNFRSHVQGSESILHKPLHLPLKDASLYSQLRVQVQLLKLAFPDLYSVEEAL